MEAGPCAMCGHSPCQFICSCILPPIPFCKECVSSHLIIEVEGRHQPTLVPMKDPGSLGTLNPDQLCEECKRQVATRFCLCRFPYFKFCDRCGISHYQRAPRATHSEHPIAECQAVLSGQVPVTTFRAKQMYISGLEAQLEQDIYEFDSFARQVEEELTTLVGEVVAKKEAVLKDLADQRPKLVAAVVEAKQVIAEKRYLETFVVSTYLDDRILNGYEHAVMKDLKIFTCQINSREMLDKLVQYELSTKLKEEIVLDLPVIKDQNIRLFSPIDLTMTQLTLSRITVIDDSTAFCFIGKHTLLACGAMNVQGDVYEINIRTGLVTPRPNMPVNKHSVGICTLNYHVYVFAGHDNSKHLDSAEKYSLASKSWTCISNRMNRVKDCCSIAQHSSGLYISGCAPTHTIEHFDPARETFRLLRESGSHLQMLFCVGDELISIRGDTIETADLSKGPESIVFTKKKIFAQIGNGHYCMRTPAQWFRGKFVGVLNNINSYIGLYTFNPREYQFTQIAAFTY